MISEHINLLVVSAHAADFVWRSGGTIAKYVKHGASVHLVFSATAPVASPMTYGTSKTRPLTM